MSTNLDDGVYPDEVNGGSITVSGGRDAHERLQTTSETRFGSTHTFGGIKPLTIINFSAKARFGWRLGMKRR